MRQGGLIALIIVALLLATVDAYLSVNSLVLSIYGYRSPLKSVPPLSEDLTSPLTEQVVLVLVDGLRYDTSLQMPYLNSLRQRGAQARLMASPPSTTQTAWVTLISGAGPEVNDMPPFERGAELLQPLAIDHLFAAVRRAGGSVGIAGFQWWEKLVSPDSLDLKYYVNTEDDAADSLVVDRALVFIQQFQPSFLLVNLRQVQAAAQAFGGDSAEYAQAALRCDEYIHRLAAQMDLQHSALAVCSSHGYLSSERDGVPVDSGGYGGDEAVVLTTPLVIAGESVGPGDYGVLNQTDLAPMIATLLGTPIPSAGQGRLPAHMLRMELVDKAEKLLALARQRVRIGNIYLYSIGKGTLTQTAEGDMLVAESSMQVKNYESAAELAALSIQQTDREIMRARRARLWAERLQRAPAVAAAVLVPLWLLWLRRSKRLTWNTLAALLAAGLYHALFLGQGGAYAFSRIPSGGLAATLDPSLHRAILSLAVGGLLVALWMWHEKQRSFFLVCKSGYVYTLVLLYWIGLPIAVCTWWSGPRLTWYIPNLTVTYVHFTLLEQAMLSAALAIALPLPVLILQRVLLTLSDSLARARAGRQRAHTQARPDKEA